MTKTEMIERIATLIAWNNYQNEQEQHAFDQKFRDTLLIENTAYRRVARELKLDRDTLNRLATLKWHQYKEQAIAKGQPLTHYKEAA